jgi:DNA-binding transcriptional LysR family regulator
MPLDWDDCRFFLAVIDNGSTKRAATVLRVDQTTCARRIGALEAALGLQLFSRDGGRYQPTEDALDLVAPARAMAAAANHIGACAASKKRHHASVLRITGEEATASAFIFPAVARFMALKPEVQVDVDVTAIKRDLLAGEADLAVRGGFPPDEPGLVRSKIGDDPFGFYVVPGYPDPPRTREALAGHPIACFDVLRPQLEAAGLGASVRHVTNSATALRRMVEAGGLVGLLPRSAAEASPPLHLCIAVPVEIAIWLVYPERLRGMPSVKLLRRLLVEEYRSGRKEGRIG